MRYAKQYFRKYPAADVLFFTADNMAFTTEAEANTHAADLDDDAVIALGRREAKLAMRDMHRSLELAEEEDLDY